MRASSFWLSWSFSVVVRTVYNIYVNHQPQPLASSTLVMWREAYSVTDARPPYILHLLYGRSGCVCHDPVIVSFPGKSDVLNCTARSNYCRLPPCMCRRRTWRELGGGRCTRWVRMGYNGRWSEEWTAAANDSSQREERDCERDRWMWEESDRDGSQLGSRLMDGQSITSSR